MGIFKVLAYVAAGLGEAVGTPLNASLAVASGDSADAAASAGAREVAQAHSPSDAVQAAEVGVVRVAHALGLDWGGTLDAPHQAWHDLLSAEIRQHPSNEAYLDTLFALALALAHLEGGLSPQQQLEIEGFIQVAAEAHVAPATLAEFKRLAAAPPSLDAALAALVGEGLQKSAVAEMAIRLLNEDASMSPQKSEALAKLAALR